MLDTLTLHSVSRQRRKRRNRKLAAYTRGDSRGLLSHAAPPPSITVERPSINISRPVSDPMQGPTPVFSLRKSAEYHDQESGVLPPEHAHHNNHIDAIEISELPASDVPEFPATPYDPHHSRSRSASPPRYSYASSDGSDPEGHYDDPLAPRPLRFSGSSTGSGGKNNSYAPLLNNPPPLEDHPAYSSSNTNNNYTDHHHRHPPNLNSIPLTAYNSLPLSTTPRSSDPRRASKSFSFASNAGADDTLTYLAPVSSTSSSSSSASAATYLSTTSNLYAFSPTPIEGRVNEFLPQLHDRTGSGDGYRDVDEYDGRGRGRGRERERDGSQHAEIEIVMGNPLQLPDGPFSPGGERAQQAVAARGGRSEWYRSPPGSARGGSLER